MSIFIIIIFSLLFGFCVGVTITFLYISIHYKNKGVKMYGYSNSRQDKEIVANAEFLKPSKNEHAASDFK
ncbi:MAG: hypothetical protein K6G88_03865 [Lachnospiraceae bacterium]|nr:hypothetical protein [Lachnospiraceae bacterium]